MRTSDIRALVETKFNYFVNVAKDKYGFNKPIYFSTREERTTGYVNLDKRIIYLNKWLVMELRDVYLNDVLPHEIAHIIHEWRDGRIFADQWEDDHPEEFWVINDELGGDRSLYEINSNLFLNILYFG